MGIPDHLTCFPRNLYSGQEATVRTRHGTGNWFQIGKRVDRHPVYFTYMQSTSCEMPGWMNHKLESRLPGEISITSDMQMTPPLWLKVKRNWRPLDESERGEWKSGLKTQQSRKEEHAITSWQIDGETMETMIDFILLGFKVTADGDCSHEIKGRLLLGRKGMTKLDSILKRHYFVNTDASN